MPFDPTTETRLWHATVTREKAEDIAKKNNWTSYDLIDSRSGDLRWIVIKKS